MQNILNEKIAGIAKLSENFEEYLEGLAKEIYPQEDQKKLFDAACERLNEEVPGNLFSYGLMQELFKEIKEIVSHAKNIVKEASNSESSSTNQCAHDEVNDKGKEKAIEATCSNSIFSASSENITKLTHLILKICRYTLILSNGYINRFDWLKKVREYNINIYRINCEISSYLREFCELRNAMVREVFKQNPMPPMSIVNYDYAYILQAFRKPSNKSSNNSSLSNEVSVLLKQNIMADKLDDGQKKLLAEAWQKYFTRQLNYFFQKCNFGNDQGNEKKYYTIHDELYSATCLSPTLQKIICELNLRFNSNTISFEVNSSGPKVRCISNATIGTILDAGDPGTSTHNILSLPSAWWRDKYCYAGGSTLFLSKLGNIVNRTNIALLFHELVHIYRYTLKMDSPFDVFDEPLKQYPAAKSIFESLFDGACYEYNTKFGAADNVTEESIAKELGVVIVGGHNLAFPERTYWRMNMFTGIIVLQSIMKVVQGRYSENKKQDIIYEGLRNLLELYLNALTLCATKPGSSATSSTALSSNISPDMASEFECKNFHNFKKFIYLANAIMKKGKNNNRAQKFALLKIIADRTIKKDAECKITYPNKARRIAIIHEGQERHELQKRNPFLVETPTEAHMFYALHDVAEKVCNMTCAKVDYKKFAQDLIVDSDFMKQLDPEDTFELKEIVRELGGTCEYSFEESKYKLLAVLRDRCNDFYWNKVQAYSGNSFSRLEAIRNLPMQTTNDLQAAIEIADSQIKRVNFSSFFNENDSPVLKRFFACIKNIHLNDPQSVIASVHALQKFGDLEQTGCLSQPFSFH